MSDVKEAIDKYRSKSVLYVEDEDFIREQMLKILKRIFDDVTPAIDGVDAYSKYSKRHFDVVLTDIHMPNMDGIELSKKILTHSPAQIVVALTAFNQNNEMLELLKVGVKTIINKPVALPDLFDTFTTIF